MKKALFLSLAAVLLIAAVLVSSCVGIEPSTAESSAADSAADTSGADSQPAASTAEPSLGDGTSSPAEESASPSVTESAPSEEEPASQPESTANSTDGDPQEKKVVSFLACPDNIIHPSVYYNALQIAAAEKGVDPDYSNLQTADYNFAPMYDDIKQLIASADLSYINVETLIGGNSNPINGYPMFNSPEAAGETLLSLGFDVFNLAHNHMLDSGDDRYLINCDRFFTERGGTTIGYYENSADTENIVVVERNGIRIAFLAYTYATNGITLSSSAQTFIPYMDEALIKRQMAIAKERADLVFVSMHWGDEDSFTPNGSQRSIAQLLVDEGADVIIGMHPHVIQEAKWVTREDGSRCFLVYSLGNLVSGMYGGKNALGLMLSLDIVKEGNNTPYVDNVRLTPTVCHYVKKASVNPQMDTGFRDFKIYRLENYTEELAANHGCHQNGGKITSFDPELDGSFSLATLKAKVKKIIPAEFLPAFLQ